MTLGSCKVKKVDKVGAGPQKMAVNMSLIEGSQIQNDVHLLLYQKHKQDKSAAPYLLSVQLVEFRQHVTLRGYRFRSGQVRHSCRHGSARTARAFTASFLNLLQLAMKTTEGKVLLDGKLPQPTEQISLYDVVYLVYFSSMS